MHRNLFVRERRKMVNVQQENINLETLAHLQEFNFTDKMLVWFGACVMTGRPRPRKGRYRDQVQESVWTQRQTIKITKQ